MKRTYLMILMLAFGITTLTAQHKIAHEEYNALKHLQQQRYRPQQQVFNPHAKGKHISLGAFGGISYSPSPNPPRHSFEMGLNVSKQLSALHTLRVGGLFSLTDQNQVTHTHLYRYALEADHLFNIYNYLAGYRPNRSFDLYTVTGLGGYLVDGHKGTKFAMGFHTGFHLTKHITSNWDLYIEPRFHLFTDGYDGVVNNCQNNERYHYAAQFLAGTAYHFTGPVQMPRIHARPLQNIYYEIYTGLQGDYNYRVTSHFSSKLKPLGPVAGMSLGKWFLPFGVRTTVFSGFHHVPSPDKKNTSEEVYAGLRFEAMVNFNNLFRHSVTRPVVEINGAVGIEGGMLAHKPGNRYADGYKPFYGLTSALQAVVPLTDNYGVFIQGRYSPSTFRQTYKSGSTWNSSMYNYGVEIGMQYRRRESGDHFHQPFSPYNFVSGSVGTNFVYNTSTMHALTDIFHDHRLGIHYTLSVGRRLTRYSTLRASVDTGRFPISGQYRTAKPISFSADYMFDMTTLFRGYREDRLFTVHPFVGLVYTHTDRTTYGGERYRPTSKGNYYALQLGLNQDFRINSRCGVFMEETLRTYKDEVLPGARLFTKFNLSAILNANVGFRWKL